MKMFVIFFSLLAISQSGFAANKELQCPQGSARNLDCKLLSTQSKEISQNFKELLICSKTPKLGYVVIRNDEDKINILPVQTSSELGFGNYQFSDYGRDLNLGLTVSQPPFPGNLSFLDAAGDLESGSFSNPPPLALLRSVDF